MSEERNKALTLLSVLGPLAGQVMTRLQPELAQELNRDMQIPGRFSPTNVNALADEVIQYFHMYQEQRQPEPPPPPPPPEPVVQYVQESVPEPEPEPMPAVETIESEPSTEYAETLVEEIPTVYAEQLPQEYAHYHDAAESKPVIPPPEPVPVAAPVFEPEDTTPVPPADYAAIAQSLSSQRPQIIAFLLSRLDPAIQRKLMRQFTEILQTQILGTNIEHVPLSDKVYNQLCAKFFPPELLNWQS